MSHHTFRSVIIGCGTSAPGKGGAHSIGYAHAAAYKSQPDVVLSAVSSLSQKDVDDFAVEYPGTKGYTDYQAMLTSEAPDIVSICAFPPAREEMAMAAMAAGAKALWIEKPFALTLDAAKRIMVEAERRSVRLFVDHQRRYGQPFIWLREAVEEKKIGDLIQFNITQPFGGIYDFGTHCIDSALYCLGDRQPTLVFAAVDLTHARKHQGMTMESQIVATVHLDDGTRLVIEMGDRACSRLPILHAEGTDGFAQLHMNVPQGCQSIFRARYAGSSEMVNPLTNEHFHHSDDGACYIKRALADILTAMKTSRATRIDAREAYRGLSIIAGIFESAKTQSVFCFERYQAN
jgi:predicted dehydrogenase